MRAYIDSVFMNAFFVEFVMAFIRKYITGDGTWFIFVLFTCFIYGFMLSLADMEEE